MKHYLTILFFVIQSVLWAQTPKNPNPSEIYHRLQKLNTLGSALYIAAHPDDENTKLISYLSNHHQAETSYFSFTRGNGGQNLISEELGKALGIIRTYELYNARKIDGGKQYFSTADDFGYSKLPTEAFEKWNDADMLDQLVYAIRVLQPDIIVNRFDHRKEGVTHGHHTASAQLAIKAYDLAADSSYVTKIGPTETWKVKRLFFNVSYWFYGGKDAFAKADKSKYIALDIGKYYPLLGYSNQEIASKSRSQHQSQGFGDMSSRGSDIEYLELIKGEKINENSPNLFEGINTSWSRISKTANLQRSIDNLLQNFDFVVVENNVKPLLTIYEEIQKLPESFYKSIKLKETRQLIVDCLGLYIEVSSPQKFGTFNDTITLKLEIANRSHQNINIHNLNVFSKDFSIHTEVLHNETHISFLENIALNERFKSSINYSNNTLQLFKNQFIRNESNVINISVNNKPISLPISVIYKYKDEVKGEIHQPFHVIPQLSLSWDFPTYYGKSNPQLTIQNYAEEFSGQVNYYLDNMLIDSTPIKLSPSSVNIYTLDLSKVNTNGLLRAEITNGKNTYSNTIKWVEYSHIPNQYYEEPAIAKRLEIANHKAKKRHIGYIMGAGDEIPKFLQQIGYKVDVLNDESLLKDDLKKYDAIIVGIRAYNTRHIFTKVQDRLLDFVKNGGNLIVQYQTNHNLRIENIGPYPFSITRDRVTDENAPVHFIYPEHIRYPYRLNPEMFTDWIQEQGLYYAAHNSPNYSYLFESNDPQEPSTNGGLIYSKYGKGVYVYTGLSFFRQIPNGSVGAMQLLINLIEMEHEK